MLFAKFFFTQMACEHFFLLALMISTTPGDDGKALLVKELPMFLALATATLTVIMLAVKLLNFRKKIENPRKPHIEVILHDGYF
jgi:DMSO/TMAO reductase YedYZ heme-binding membrane subunit